MLSDPFIHIFLIIICSLMWLFYQLQLKNYILNKMAINPIREILDFENTYVREFLNV